MKARSPALFVALVMPLFAVACGADGDDPAAWGMTRHVQRDGLFAIAYVSPPWELLSGDEALRLRITPELFGYDVGLAASTHGLDVRAVAVDDDIGALQGVEGFVPKGEGLGIGDVEIPGQVPRTPLAGVDLLSPFSIARAELTELLVHHNALIDFDLVEFQSADGVEALTFQVVTTHDTFMRVDYLRSEQGVVRAAMVSVFDLATPDVRAMLSGLEIDVEPPAGEAP